MDFVDPVSALIPGAQGRILSVLAETTAELNLRTLARLAGVSAAQASRVMPELVELGVVERREVPPSSQFRLARDNVAAEAVLVLARSRERALHLIGQAAFGLPIPPAAVIIFGSFARGQATRESDIDAVIVRPDDIDDDDATWGSGVEQWRDVTRSITGNRVQVLEVSLSEARSRIARKSGVWRDIVRHGVPVYGRSPTELAETIHA